MLATSEFLIPCSLAVAQKYSVPKEQTVGWAKRSGPINATSVMGPLRLAHPTICSFGIEYFGTTAKEQGIRNSEPETSAEL